MVLVLEVQLNLACPARIWQCFGSCGLFFQSIFQIHTIMEYPCY